MEKFIPEARLFFKKEVAYHLNLIWDACSTIKFNETTKFLVVPTDKVATATLQHEEQFFRYAVFTFLKEKIFYVAGTLPHNNLPGMW